jgi:ABC-type uncharacterized transport system permease subunit
MGQAFVQVVDLPRWVSGWPTWPSGNPDRLPELIRSGELDVMLLSVLGQLCAADFALRRLGRVVAGAR